MSRTSSGSNFSDSAVEPTMSQNMTVICRRSAADGAIRGLRVAPLALLASTRVAIARKKSFAIP